MRMSECQGIFKLASPLRQCGFSLLEVLVAFTIVALSLSVIMNIFSLSVLASGRVDQQRQALLLAESKLALLIAENTAVGFYQGRFDSGQRWQSRVEDVSDIKDELRRERAIVHESAPFKPLNISLQVSWGKNSQLTLQRLYLHRKS